MHSRHRHLLDLIRPGRQSAPALATALGISVRTVYRDIANLRRRGHAIVGVIGRKGGFALADDGVVGVRLKPEDVREIVAALALVAHHGQTLTRLDHHDLVDRLLSALPGTRERGIRKLLGIRRGRPPIRGCTSRHMDVIEGCVRACHQAYVVDKPPGQYGQHGRTAAWTTGLPEPLKPTGHGWIMPLVADGPSRRAGAPLLRDVPVQWLCNARDALRPGRLTVRTP